MYIRISLMNELMKLVGALIICLNEFSVHFTINHIEDFQCYITEEQN